MAAKGFVKVSPDLEHLLGEVARLFVRDSDLEPGQYYETYGSSAGRTWCVTVGWLPKGEEPPSRRREYRPPS